MSDFAPATSATAPAPARHGLLAAGNWIIDHVKTIDAWPAQDGLVNILAHETANGGGPYNVLKDLAKLRAPFPLAGLGLVGDDSDGRAIRADCAAHGIDASRLQATPDAATSHTDVMTVRDTGRRTFFHARAANALLAPAHFDFTGCTARWFYLGYLLLLDTLDAPEPATGAPRARAVLRAAREAGLLTAVDCVSAASERFRAVATPVVPEVDVLFANDYEAEQLTGLALGRGPALDRAAVESAARALLALGVRRHAIIHFPEGACAASVDGSVVWQASVAVPPALVAGAAGAGDAFAAGCLLALHEERPRPVAAALRLGVCAAATSLLHPTCSGGILSAADALAFGEAHGFRALA